MGLILTQTPACSTDLPEAPRLDDVQDKFDAPTGSIIAKLPPELATLFNASKDAAEPLQTPSESSIASVDSTLAKLQLPVDGYIRVTKKCADAGELSAVILVGKSNALPTFRAEAKKCQGDFGSKVQVDGTLDVSIEFLPWALIAFSGSTTPIENGVVAPDKATQVTTAFRICTGPSSDACKTGDVELSVDLTQGNNVVFLVSVGNKVAGIRDKDGTWICTADVADPTAAVCTLAGNNVTIPGVNS
jgi:hypothetical protein